MTDTLLAQLALGIPLGAAALLAAVPMLRRSGRPAGVVSVLAATASLSCAVWLLVGRSEGADAVVSTTTWIPVAGDALVDVGVRIDGVSVSMALIVTLVAWAVQVFSLGYMQGEDDAAFGRYFTYHSLFIFSMLTLVFAPNMLQFFGGWELVGLTSYLLIGFYYQKPSAARAAVKAFWITKAADIGLLLGLILLYVYSGGFAWTAELTSSQATVVTALFFLGVMGKSAQFPLHIWLPNAMEGPTPVSALLHAATMVAAGVYLVVRCDPLFDLAEATRTAMMYIGGFTALFAACIAVVQTDIKKILAYSTCSQLGYMICALGAGSLMGGYFHLTTHAFFKALLFLGAGSVIHAVHSNELKDMGGLAKKMKVTTLVFIIGALALAGIPGFSGFFSKELILEALFESGHWVPYGFLMAAAFLTAFYMGRLVFLAFFGEPSEKAAEAHESGPSMLVPLVLLAIPAAGLGFGASTFAGLYGEAYAFHVTPTGAVASALALLGLGLSYLVYGSKTIGEDAFSALAPIGRLIRSGAIDRFAASLYAKNALALGAMVAWVDRYVVDGLINLSASMGLTAGRKLRAVQTGNVRDYVFVLVLGMLVISAWSLLS